MENFNLELLQMFRDFKIDRFSELEKVNKDQENKFKNLLSVSEQVSEHLHSLIWELKTQVKDLKKELVLLRERKDDQSMEYQRRLMEEEQNVEWSKLRLKIENERTRAHAVDMASLRDAKNQEIMDCRRLLMEEKKKNKELSAENKRLKQQQEKLICSRLKNTKDAQLCISTTTSVDHVARDTPKHTKRSGGRKMRSPLA